MHLKFNLHLLIIIRIRCKKEQTKKPNLSKDVFAYNSFNWLVKHFHIFTNASLLFTKGDGRNQDEDVDEESWKCNFNQHFAHNGT